MKKLPFITLLLALPLATTAGAKGIDPTSLPLNTDIEPDLSQAGFIELFNGKDLSGWTMRGGQMIFEAKDGAIIGTTVKGQPNSFLCTDANYSDFIFTSEFKWEVLGNSGIMFRAGTKPPDEKGFERVFGYQSEMDNKDRRYTGGIYGEAMGGWKYPLSKPKEHAAARAAIVDHMAWNRVTIYAKGNEIKTWINGVPCSNLVNDERSEGFFGLQVHSGAQGTIHWRNIKLKDLSDAPQAVDLFASGDFSAWSKNQWRTCRATVVHSGWRDSSLRTPR